ncbi:MAG: STAS domain-containing protein [Bacteroidota bacterium]
MNFSFETEAKNGAVIIRPIGSLIEKSQAEGMLKQVEDNIGKGNCLFILDFSLFEYMNSSGLGVFLTILTKTRSKDGEVIIAHVNPKIRELLIITKLITVFKVCDTLDEALAGLQNN